MISFFRKIRQKLLQHLPAGKAGNRITRYLAYAIGEIFLVVIGILIALQVNNWNENNKTRSKEQILVASLKEEATLASELADTFIEAEETNISVLELMLKKWPDLTFDLIKGEFRPFQESNFSPIFNMSGYSQFFDPRMDVYNAAVSDGSLSIIQDKRLTRRLDALYNYSVPRINELMNEEYLLGQSINEHIAVRYQHVFLDNTLKDSLKVRPNLWSEDTYEVLFKEFREDGVLKYKLAHRLELKRSRLLLILQAKDFIATINSD
ncbi:hypothetical protein E4S40_15415 [Algoriphagus kandeliae]|uniref:Uncharacterized protein n=1 Tax=Algoriphagus kandeliae TaxID=2562278 RepID=A0A4Y9QN05_9BACT|nr:DUF6090 family protein [Algoriphagus kandeliae]TFV93630.1 hypothetical protein E4S40_15415 [Algoriphagus kandeliae]